MTNVLMMRGVSPEARKPFAVAGTVTIAEIVAATDWQPHTVRGAMAGALKKKLGLEVASEKIDGRGRVYRLPPA